MFENDYIMRLIHEMVRAVLKLLLGKDTDVKDELVLPEVTEDNDFQVLILLVKQGKINEAQNQLFDKLFGDSERYFKIALLFYDYLNDLDDEYLEASGYSREEIAEGLKTVMEQNGYGGLARTFLL